MKTEKIPLAFIYKQDGNINIEFQFDSGGYELLGFLKCLIKKMEKDLINAFEENN